MDKNSEEQIFLAENNITMKQNNMKIGPIYFEIW